MHFEDSRSLNLPLLASLCGHGLVLGLLGWAGFVRDAASDLRTLPSWAADSVEVGIAPAAQREPAPASPPEPAAAAPAPPASPLLASEGHEVSPPEPAAAAKRAPEKPLAKRETPAASASPSAVTASASPSGVAPTAEPSAPSGSMGSLGLPPGVQHFARAFSWALPEGGHRDRSWSELPLGPVGKAVIDVTIDADGRIESVVFDPDVPPPAAVKKMIDHAVFLLRPRRFSLDAKSVDAGVERLSIDVTLSQEAARDDDDSNPLGLASEGHKPPEGDRPGYARFTLNSGRHLEAALRREPKR